jgi:opacity protein-like surface antigen
VLFRDLRTKAQAHYAERLNASNSNQYTYDYEKGIYVTPEESQEANKPLESAPPSDIIINSGNGYTSSAAGIASGFGQYSAGGNYFSPAYTSDPYLGGRRNIKLGGLNLAFGVSSILEYNTNIARLPNGQEVGDAIWGNYFNISANYPITRYNTLTLSAVVGYEQLFDHPELVPYGSGGGLLNILPGSTLEFNGWVGDVFVSIYDRFSVKPAAINDFVIGSSQVFGLFENEIGVGASWAINKQLELSGVYRHLDSIALDDAADIYAFSSDSIAFNLRWTPYDTWSLGLIGSITSVRYQEDFNNDSVWSSIGVFFDHWITPNSYIAAHIGYQKADFESLNSNIADINDVRIASQNVTNAEIAFDNAVAAAAVAEDNPATPEINEIEQAELNVQQAEQARDNARATEAATRFSFNSSNQDRSGLSDIFYGAGFTSRLNSRIIYTLGFAHETGQSNVSNHQNTSLVIFTMGAAAWHGSRLHFSTSYGRISQSQSTLGDEYDTLTIGLNYTQQITSRLNVSFRAGYNKLTSQISDLGISQQNFDIDARYALSKKMSLQLGYRYLQNDQDADQFSFDQHRFLMGVNYNF